jgi:hypothetical protein
MENYELMYSQITSGFVLEGIKRKANWVEGKWEDIYCMGILASDWMSAHPAAIKP